MLLWFPALVYVPRVPPSVPSFSEYFFHCSVRCTSVCPMFLHVPLSLLSSLYRPLPYLSLPIFFIVQYAVPGTAVCSIVLQVPFPLLSTLYHLFEFFPCDFFILQYRGILRGLVYLVRSS